MSQGDNLAIGDGIRVVLPSEHVLERFFAEARPAAPGQVSWTGSGSRMPARTAAPAAASRPRASQVLASPP